MRRIVVLGVTTLALLVPRTPRAEPAVTLSDLLLGFAAKETCSCAFVVGQDDAYCNAFGQSGSFPVDLVIDRAGKSAAASVGAQTRRANFKDGAGCTLDVTQ